LALEALAEWARRRSFDQKTFSTFSQFQENQNSWDRYGLYLIAVFSFLTIVAIGLLSSVIKTAVQQVNPNFLDGNSANYIQQLEQTTQSYQDLLNGN